MSCCCLWSTFPQEMESSGEFSGSHQHPLRHICPHKRRWHLTASFPSYPLILCPWYAFQTAKKKKKLLQLTQKCILIQIEKQNALPWTVLENYNRDKRCFESGHRYLSIGTTLYHGSSWSELKSNANVTWKMFFHRAHRGWQAADLEKAC